MPSIQSTQIQKQNLVFIKFRTELMIMSDHWYVIWPAKVTVNAGYKGEGTIWIL